MYEMLFCRLPFSLEQLDKTNALLKKGKNRLLKLINEANKTKKLEQIFAKLKSKEATKLSIDLNGICPALKNLLDEEKTLIICLASLLEVDYLILYINYLVLIKIKLLKNNLENFYF